MFKTYFKPSRRLVAATVALLFISACEPNTKPAQSPDSAAQKDLITSKVSNAELIAKALIGSHFEASTAPLAQQYKAKIQRTLSSEFSVLRRNDLRDKRAQRAQDLFLADQRLLTILQQPGSNAAFRNEVMTVAPALPGDRVGEAKSCQLGECYRVTIYNFYHNVSIIGIVDIVSQQVLKINSQPETQPDLSPRLARLAEAIANHEPLVQQQIARYQQSINLADAKQAPKALMVSTKSSLKNSLCERSKHLCVAPTYVLGNQALWVIVDLTDFKVAGVRWTTVGDDAGQSRLPPEIVTQRTLENHYVFQNFCAKTTTLERNGWSLQYNLTASDGLRVAHVSHNKRAVFKSAKVVDWHVSYSRSDDFGYSDATGCPMFSSAVVVAYNGPKIEPITANGEEVGFSVAQDFRQLPWPAACNYRYEERYEFYNDGRYRVALSNHGRGCGINGTYRPVLRLQFGDGSSDSGFAMQKWAADEWHTIETEEWSKQPAKSAMHQGKYSHRIIVPNGQAYAIAPSIGEFNDGGRGDNAYLYLTALHQDKDEGAADLVTLGACCNKDHRQGPEQFMQPAEPLQNSGLVFWYVPQIENDGREASPYCWAGDRVVEGVRQTQTWPCTAGPMFVPESPVNVKAEL